MERFTVLGDYSSDRRRVISIIISIRGKDWSHSWKRDTTAYYESVVMEVDCFRQAAEDMEPGQYYQRGDERRGR